MEFEITVRRRKHIASPERVLEALEGVEPERGTMYMVEVEGVSYPVKQAFCEAFDVGRRGVNAGQAATVFERLGFEVTRDPVVARRRGTPEEKASKAPGAGGWSARHGKQDEPELAELEIGTIPLRWSFLEEWEDIARHWGVRR